MPTSYTSLLGLALPVTGELSGTWGDVVNNYLTSYVDASVAGSQTISGNQTSVTLSTTNGSALTQAGGAGVTGSSQYFIINCTGNPASTLTITAPASSKSYIVINQTSTSQSVILRGAGPTTGVTIASGDKALVAWNGSDFVRVGASAGGSNTQVQYNNGGNLAGSANMTFDGTKLTVGGVNNTALTASKPVFTDSSKNLVSTGTMPVDQGGTGQTTYTDGQILIGNTTGNTLTKATLTQGTGVTITNGSGSITIANAGVTAISGTSNQVIASASTGSITLSTPQSIGTSSSVQFGSFGVGTAASGTTGEIRATNNVTAYYSSDIKFKTNVRDIPNALATVNSIGGKLFHWTDAYINEHGGADGYFVQKEDFGVIAQDVQKVFPVAVRTRADGSLAVDYEKLGALAFAALCELTKRVEALEAK